MIHDALTLFHKSRIPNKHIVPSINPSIHPSFPSIINLQEQNKNNVQQGRSGHGRRQSTIDCLELCAIVSQPTRMGCYFDVSK
jgi:hypothetical protein